MSDLTRRAGWHKTPESLPVIILAGGLGSRLTPMLPDRPKGLAPIECQPFLEILICLLRRQGAKRFVLCLGHRSEQIQSYFGDGERLGVKIEYSVEEEQLLGTAGALKQAEQFFQPRALVVNGDTYFDLNYSRLVRFHLEQRDLSGAFATLALAQVCDASSFGTVTLDLSGQYIQDFQEKSPLEHGPGWINGGVYVMEKALLEFIPQGEVCSLERDVFPKILNAGKKLAARTAQRRFFDIGTPERLEEFRAFWSRKERKETLAVP